MSKKSRTRMATAEMQKRLDGALARIAEVEAENVELRSELAAATAKLEATKTKSKTKGTR